MAFHPDFRHFEAVMQNRRPARLPVYEHLIDVADGNATRSEFETLRQMQQALRDPSRRSTKDP